MPQSFAAIGPRSSEISRWNKKKKETAVKHETAGNYRSGRPNEKEMLDCILRSLYVNKYCTIDAR